MFQREAMSLKVLVASASQVGEAEGLGKECSTADMADRAQKT